MKYLKSLAVVLLSLVIFGRCKYDKLSTCDTSEVKYGTNIKPILQNNCYTCHAQSNHVADGGGYNLEVFDSLKKFVDDGRLLKAVNWSDPSNVSAMPKGGAKLPECDLSKIEKWITAGAPEN